MQADNGKEFKGALLILLRKYGIQVVNGAPRSPQTQGLVEQANGVVENKLRAWKMDHGSTEWKDGLLEVILAMNLFYYAIEQANGVVENKLRAWKMDHGSTEWKDGLLEVILAMNTQIHSTIGCAPAELLFREQTSHIDWLNSQARKDLSIGVEQKDPTMAPIFESEPEPELEPELEALIDPQLQQEPELGIELLGSRPNSEPSSSSELELEPEPEQELNLGSGLEPELEPELRLEPSSGEHQNSSRN
ncbi:hypothetical protein O988_00644 [Pseudogymnoascus sp. VKM F-3808]|nr:hypothetical protein O988_00644 [Pseudogymnoascus sp. VKM F-3808]